MSSGPTQEQIARVRAILYRHSTLTQVRNDLSSIDVLLGLAPSTPAGSGPAWVIPATGRVGPSVTQAAGYARKLASTYLRLADQIGALSSVPAADRAHLVKALASQASAWSARADAWARPEQPSSFQTKAALAAIVRHETAGTAAAQKVTAYLLEQAPH
jgi:hypothetical protein